MHTEQELREDIPSAHEFRYRQVLTWASILAFVGILNAFWLWISSWEIGRLLGLFVLLPFLLPYGFIPLRLHSRGFRSGVTLGMAMGFALFVPGIYLIRFVLAWDKRWWIFGNLILALSMQPVLIVFGARAFFTMPRLRYGRVKSLGSFAYGILIFGLFWSFYSPVPQYISTNEHSAMRYLEACAINAILDAGKHGGSYPMGFEGLASGSDPKCIIAGPWIINPGNPEYGYLFVYTGVPPSVTEGGCTRFKSFTMTARPVVFGRTGIRSFFVDRSMEIHATSENRPANASDPIDRTVLEEHRP